MKYYYNIFQIKLQEVNNTIISWLIYHLELMLDNRRLPIYPRKENGKYYTYKEYNDICEEYFKGIR